LSVSRKASCYQICCFSTWQQVIPQSPLGIKTLLSIFENYMPLPGRRPQDTLGVGARTGQSTPNHQHGFTRKQ
jgi:hypothetical protein